MTDGRLTVVNLAIEAGVSRATANRASRVLEAFRHAVVESETRRNGVDQQGRTDRAEQERRVVENVLAQHRQVRALYQLEKRRRDSRAADIVPMIGRTRS
jgi:hypothetical protein